MFRLPMHKAIVRALVIVIFLLGGCAQFPVAKVTDGGPPVDCGDGVEVIDLNVEGSAVRGGYSYTGQVSAGSGVHDGSCSESHGAELVLRFTPEQNGDLVVDTFGTDPRIDTVLHVRSQCDAAGTEIACNDDWLALSCFMSAVEVNDAAVAGVPVFIFADTYDNDYSGDITVTAVTRVRHQLGARCDPTGFLNRCEEGGVCKDGVCERSNPPMLSSLSVLELNEYSMRLIVVGTDEDNDVEEADVTLNVVAGEPWNWSGPFTVIDWTGSSFSAWVDLDVTELPEIVDIEVSVNDSAGSSSGTSSGTPEPIPMPQVGEACDPDEVESWCEIGLWCATETSLCTLNEAPTLESLDVRIFWDVLRVAFSGTDPEGDVLDAEVTFLDALGEEIEVDGYTDLYAELAWPLRGQTSFVGGFDVYYAPIGATGLRVEILDIAWNESNSMSVQAVEMPELSEGEACDPLALENVCGVSCDPESRTCIGEDACRHLRCTSDLPALTSGTPVMVHLRTLDFGCFISTCEEIVGPEAIYTLDVAEPSRVVITADQPSTTSLGVILSLRSDCEDRMSEIGCGDSYYFFPACSWDSVVSTVFDRLVVEDVSPGTYYVIADTWAWQGDFEITAEVIPL